MKKLMIAFAAVAMAAAANAATVTWKSGIITDHDGKALPSANYVTGYYFQIEKDAYDSWAKNTTGKALTEAVIAALGDGSLKLADAYASKQNTWSSRSTVGSQINNLVSDNIYAADDHAYALIVYEDANGADTYYMANIADYQLPSGQDATYANMATTFGGQSGSGATAWAAATVPEPTSGLLLLLGVAGLALRRRRA